MMTPGHPELDPVAIRKALVIHREAGRPWDEAWPDVVGHQKPSRDEKGLYAFMERNFRAAYYDTPSSLGRWTLPERDVSAAIAIARRGAAVTRSTRDRCRSGDGCDRPATRGSFGRLWWCEHHGLELERIAITMTELNANAAAQ